MAETTGIFSKPLATGHSWQTVFAAFVIACVAGTLWEEVLYLVQHHEWVARTGTVIGPFSPIYGYGALAFCVFLGWTLKSWTGWQSWVGTYLISCLIGGTMEFMMSLIAEVVFHEVIWDYHDRFLNICGRTTEPFMLGWGLAGLLLIKVVYPLIIKLTSVIPYAIGEPIFILLLVFMVVDLFLTYGALGRQAMRAAGNADTTNFLWQFFDKYYPDEWLIKRFPAITVNGG